nr:immunoglobulin light chain junction region [Macaca mulatta]MOW15965.1 immunoglobulin light chain junction region [Macaca mulatta]MOW17882.1 immunoglobulin light chain junction region [Macaca mulatta]MOW18551.1 immunoglobulin light chain junction region [Macaca mulatta]
TYYCQSYDRTLSAYIF